MYVPSHFAAADAEALIQRLVKRAAGILVTLGPDDRLTATHLPLVWDSERRVLTGHIARANPHHAMGEGAGLFILAGPEAYVSPSFYPSKAEHGKAVPTWNYEAVHFTGRVSWFDDAMRLERVVRALSDLHEAGRDEPWSLDDAPAEYVKAMLRGIVGVEMQVERVEAKRKLSQNKAGADFAGVVGGLRGENSVEAVEIAALMSKLPQQ